MTSNSDGYIQNITIPIFESHSSFELEELFKLQLNYFQTDWFGSAPLAKTGFVLVLTPQHLMFAAECFEGPTCDRSYCLNEFRAGLWERDVAELFLKEDHSNRYQEFNLSPSGAWWSGLFDSHRKPSSSAFLEPTGVKVFAEAKKEHWRAAISIPLSSLSVSFAFTSASKANVSFIIGGNKRQYLSWSKINAKEPDFHRVSDFEKMRRLTLCKRDL
ncbi:MAG: hypothetical protein IT291_06140 [Deltaproteobacteria bacterium]|nr:hypothetical protein [Deltaproteobacteria bacterium]